MPLTEALSPPLFHFDPFGTEFREPGRISHPITKILPAFAGVPGDHAPVLISQFPRLCSACSRSLRTQNLRYLSRLRLRDRRAANHSKPFVKLSPVHFRGHVVRDLWLWAI